MTNNEETVGQMIARAREEKHLSKRELSRIAYKVNVWIYSSNNW